GGAALAWYEYEEPVACSEGGAPPRGDRVPVAVDHRDERLSREAELSDRGAVDRVVGGDGEVDEVQLAHWPRFEWGFGDWRRAGDQREPLREPFEGCALDERGDDDDEEDGV